MILPVARVVAVANQKGGVAKTTTVLSLGVALAERGREVLLVDLDPQACLTYSLGVEPEELKRSLHDVLVHKLRRRTHSSRSADLTCCRRPSTWPARRSTSCPRPGASTRWPAPWSR